MKRRLISFFLSLALVLSLVPAAFAANFSGYSEWAYAELTEAEEYGLIADSIRAQMNAPITREEFYEYLILLLPNELGEMPETGSQPASQIHRRFRRGTIRHCQDDGRGIKGFQDKAGERRRPDFCHVHAQSGKLPAHGQRF